MPSSPSDKSNTPTLNDVPIADTLPKIKDVKHEDAVEPKVFKPDARFYLVFLALCCSMFLSALDLTAVSTVLPTIAADLKATDASWIGSSYALTSTALIPFVGGLASVFGRRPVMVGALVVFIIGSAVAASAQNYGAMIVGRSIQGIGGGSIMVATEIIVSDLVPAAVRGTYQGMLGMVWAIASAAAPPIAGALGSAGAWRWLFWLNLPIGGIALVLVLVFMNVKAPKRTFREQLGLIDVNNFLFIAASVSATLGLSWAGSTHPWSSAAVLAPLIIGLAGIVLYLLLEQFVRSPTVPWDVVGNRTAAVGLITTLWHSLIVLAIVYFFPVYFQAVKDASPAQSGVDLFSICFTIAPFAIVCGITVTISGHYKVQNLIAWALLAIGLGLMTLIKADTAKSVVNGYAAVAGIAAGLLYTGTLFPVIAPLKAAQQPQAMIAQAFTRSFGQILGIAIGGTILQAELSKKLPSEFAARFGGTGSLAFAVIPEIKSLPQPLKDEVRVAFTSSLRVIWLFCAILAAATFFIALFMRSLPLATDTDDTYGLEERKTKKSQDIETAAH